MGHLPPVIRAMPWRSASAIVATAVMIGASGAVVRADAAWTDSAFVSASLQSAKWATTGSATGTVGGSGAATVTANPSTPSPATYNGSGSVAVTSGTLEYTTASVAASYRSVEASASVTVTSARVVPTYNAGAAMTVTTSAGALASSSTCRANSASTGTLTPLANLRVTANGVTRSPTVNGDVASFADIAFNLTVGLDLLSITVGPTITRTATVVSAPTDPAVTQRLVLMPGITIKLLGITVALLNSNITLISTTCALDLP